MTGLKHFVWLLFALVIGLLPGRRTISADDLMPLFSQSPVQSDVAEPKTPMSALVEPPTPAPPAPASPAPVSPAPAPKTSTSRTPPVPEIPASDLQSQKDQRFRELKRQLEILNQLSLQRTEQSTPTTSTRESASEESALEEPMDSSEEAAASISTGQATSTPRPGEVPRHSRPSHMVHVKEPESLPAMLTPAIVEGTIDRFALAVSLFGTGQTETCLDVLKHTDLTQLSREDQIWAEYMHACCQRRAGRIDLARQSYRRILAEKDADWIAELATWWLDDLEAKAQLEADAKRLSETLAAWETEIESLSRSSTGTTADR